MLNCCCRPPKTPLQKLWGKMTTKTTRSEYPDSPGRFHIPISYVCHRPWWALTLKVWRARNTAVRLWRLFFPRKQFQVNFDRIVLPMIERVSPELITSEIIGVQPMKDYDDKPFGKIVMPAFTKPFPFPIISDHKGILSMDEIREVNKMREDRER